MSVFNKLHDENLHIHFAALVLFFQFLCIVTSYTICTGDILVACNNSLSSCLCVYIIVRDMDMLTIMTTLKYLTLFFEGSC